MHRSIYASSCPLPHPLQADLWSCGVVLYFLLCCDVPFFGESLHDMVASITCDALDLHTDPWPQISAEAKDLIARLLLLLLLLLLPLPLPLPA
jgi:serine/threonine protein kinase